MGNTYRYSDAIVILEAQVTYLDFLYKSGILDNVLNQCVCIVYVKYISGRIVPDCVKP